MIVKAEEFTYEMCKNTVGELGRRYPFAELGVIGRTWTGRAVLSMSVGEGSDNVLFIGGMGGQDRLTPLMLLRFFERLCEAYATDSKISAVRIKSTLRSRRITIVPCVNPDSVEIAARAADGAGCYAGLVSRAAKGDYSLWNSNARGVDIRKNFDFRHGSGSYETSETAMPSPSYYSGPSPESEPETKAVAKLCENNLFRYAFMLTPGREEIFMSENRDTPSSASMTAKVLSSVSGYPFGEKPESILSGTFPEWFANEFRRPAFEISTGGENPKTDSDSFAVNYNLAEELLVLGAIM